MLRRCRYYLKANYPEQGFTLVMVLAIGMIMMLMGTGLIVRSQKDSAIASARKDTGKSAAIAEAGVARTLALLKQPNNTALLTRNYDPINPRTGKTYLGADGVLNSGDEGTTAIDEWTGYNPSIKPCFQVTGIGPPSMPTTGSIGLDGTYTLRAYHYDPLKQTGMVLVEGSYAGHSNAIAVTFTIKPVLDDFPGISTYHSGSSTHTAGILGLRGRQVLGSKGNIYYNTQATSNPGLTGISAPGDATRPSYLDVIFSSATQDGATGDTVSGKIFGCMAGALIPDDGIRGSNLGIVNTSQTISGNGGTLPTLYQIDEINLSNNEVLAVDTTNGPVRIDMTSSTTTSIQLHQTAKILNIRTDGKPPSVGDLRILLRGGNNFMKLYDQTCIQNAFIWSVYSELYLLTTGPGCPSNRNTNFEGVIWSESILSSKNAASNRNISYFNSAFIDYDTLVTPGATSGIYVPEDLSSLTDVLQYVDWPVRYQISDIKNWSRQRL